MPRKKPKKGKKNRVSKSQIYPSWDIAINKGLVFYTAMSQWFGALSVRNAIKDKAVGTISTFTHTRWVLDKEFGPVFRFLGTAYPGSGISFPNLRYVVPETNKLTVAVWCKFRGGGDDGMMISRYSAAGQSWYLRKQAGQILFRCWIGGARIDTVIPYAVTLEQWYLVGARYDGSNVQVFVNNNWGAPNARAGALQYAGGTTFRLGNYGYVGFSLKGDMAEPKIWDRGLADAEIAGLYNPATRFDGFLSSSIPPLPTEQPLSPPEPPIPPVGAAGQRSSLNLGNTLSL